MIGKRNNEIMLTHEFFSRQILFLRFFYFIDIHRSFSISQLLTCSKWKEELYQKIEIIRSKKRIQKLPDDFIGVGQIWPTIFFVCKTTFEPNKNAESLFFSVFGRQSFCKFVATRIF